jgi:integrase
VKLSDEDQAKPLTKQEARKLMEALKGRRLEALYLMALLGLQRGEVLNLLIENLDWERKLAKGKRRMLRLRCDRRRAASLRRSTDGNRRPAARAQTGRSIGDRWYATASARQERRSIAAAGEWAGGGQRAAGKPPAHRVVSGRTYHRRYPPPLP